MPIIPNWPQIILETIVGACLGTIAGLVAGALTSLFVIDPVGMALGSLHANTPHQETTALAFIVVGTALGFISGAAVAFVVHMRSAHKRAATLITNL